MQQDQSAHEDRSGTELEANNVLRTLLQDNPLPERDDQALPADEVYHFDEQRALSLDCVAFVRQGKIIPLFELAGTELPQTVEGKTYLSALTAQIIMGRVLDGLELMIQHRKDGGNG